MMYQVGDVVRVIDELSYFDRYFNIDPATLRADTSHALRASEDMVQYAGKEVTITKIEERIDGMKYYRVDIDHGVWKWKDQMFCGRVINTSEPEVSEQPDLMALFGEMGG